MIHVKHRGAIPLAVLLVLVVALGLVDLRAYALTGLPVLAVW